MRYSILNFIACPETKHELVCLVLQEKGAMIGHVKFSECRHINQPGAIVGPMPRRYPHTPISSALRAEACTPADDSRKYIVAVEEGVLVCLGCGRWYPIRNFIPELLPDHLRDFEHDFAFLHSSQARLSSAVFNLLNDRSLFNRTVAALASDSGLPYKRSEMGIRDKVIDPHFFGPGYVAPFNPGTPEHTSHLIRMFGYCMSLLDCRPSKVVLDAGCGYAWTTEWMLRLGMEPIGIDISRAYVDIAVARLQHLLPHIVIGDTEKLPILPAVLDAVLGFDAFHHIPNRQQAMVEFECSLRPGGVVVLAEPPAAHESVPAVQDVMTKYGILEKGMDFSDVQGYIKNTHLDTLQQHHILRIPSPSSGAVINEDVINNYRYNPANLFTIRKPL